MISLRPPWMGIEFTLSWVTRVSRTSGRRMSEASDVVDSKGSGNEWRTPPGWEE